MNIKFVIAGCGGTGGWISYRAFQILAKLSLETAVNVECILIDHDEIEFKNTLRQAFNENDIGKNKALALTERYAPCFESIPNFKLF